MYTLPLHAATSVVANNKLPDFNSVLAGQLQGGKPDTNGLVMDVTQTTQNAVIKWNSFDIGGSATVNFDYTGKENFNTLNYVNSGSASQIYGTINAQHEGYAGDIFVVNTAGVQIGPSAQINVGSLHVSNKNLDKANFSAITDDTNLNDFLHEYDTYTNAALMSLGNINANKVTFEGDGRIVIDSERIKNENVKLTSDKIFINTNDKNNVVIGYEAYENGSYTGVAKTEELATLNGSDKLTKDDGYMWVEDVEQLQAIGENEETLTGNYALRNSIDGTEANNFAAIGNSTTAFSGKFDGIDYNIFNLNINGTENVGLFGKTDRAVISNVTMVGGNVTGTGSNVGAIVGNAQNTTLTNVVNSAAVTGNSNVGGIVGNANNTIVKDAVNTGTIKGNSNDEANVGGLIGSMTGDGKDKSRLEGNSYNLGDVSGKGYNVGGLVGHAVNSTIGDGTNLVYNRLDVEGKYNVGGIVGNMKGTTVQNAENSGNVTASGYTNGTYSYHSTHYKGVKDETVNVANVGGIAGKADNTNSQESKIENVTNSGNVSSSKQDNNNYYDAGNIGGIVGSAVDTDITNATNRENEVRGAHNVGGVAGYFSGSATITGGINDGGDIMATGARNANGFVKETVRPVGDANESFIIGNIGGVVGYLEGDNVYVTGSANRGTVHTDEPAVPADVKEWQKAANVGGVVGKIDREIQNTLDGIKGVNGADKETAAVTNSYNTGDVLGYTGVGGVIGMMYNGAVSGSYNLGTVNTTRQVDRSGGSNIDPLNMGGIVGDTTEETNASAIIYDVYNKGQIGDEEFNYYARHVGGIVGRLSGAVEKAYNTGDIYNNDTVVGGIAGWWYSGTINNAFNTGNITAITATELQVGGLVGAAGANANSLTNAYNLGTIRGYQQDNNQEIYLGGIVGKAANLRIDNVYTLGNLYAGRGLYTYTKENNGVGYIYGGNNNQNINVQNSYYITSEDPNSFSEGNDNGATLVDFANRYVKDSYDDFSFSTQTGGIVSDNGVWRIYEGSTTPILNAFLPNTEKYFGNTPQNPDAMNNITSIQYGTAYDPLLTIINATNDLNFDWNELGIGGAGSLVVYGGGLTLDNVSTSNATGGSSYYGGVLYSDGALTIKGNENENLGFGSASELYGSEVTIKADGTVTIYGDVTATGNANDNDTTGNVTINAGDVNVYGTLTSATAGKDVSISGIANKGNGELTFNDVNNPYSAMPHVGDRFNINITAKDNIDGDITITAGQNDTGNGNVNLYFGNKEEGLITSGGDLNVTGTGNVFVNSDLDIEGNMTLTSTGKDGEVLLTLTNIGKVQANRFTEVIEKAINGIEVIAANENKLIDAINLAVGKEFPDLGFSDDPKKAEAIVRILLSGNNKVEAIDTLNNDVAIEYMHDFMHSFERSDNQDTPVITLSSASGNSKLTVDMWEDNDNGTGQFNFEKYDSNSIYTSDEHTFVGELNNLNLTINDNSNIDAADVVYVEVHNGEQLKGIQDYVDSNVENASDALKFNYALMGDINASDVENYVAIGGTTGFTGTFDGRGNRIIGLKVDNNNGDAGIFSTIGKDGTVKNVNIYSGNFTGTTSAGAVAGMNSGRIENVTGFGNTVQVNDAGSAGGIVGVNTSGSFDENGGALTGGIYDVQNIGSVIAGNGGATAGGLVGSNTGALGNSYSDSAVTSTAGTSNGLGGVVGVNTGDVQFVDSLGVTNGGTNSDKVGGIIGVNEGNMYSGYNESIVSGKNNVGGIVGVNTNTVSNIVNATGINGNDYVGGLVGDNDGNVSSGRNNGTITGNDYVGGMVGSNGADSILENLVNAESADIVGEDYVGGIAGTNSGEITADDQSTLDNLGSITGQNYVGGVAGENIGTIQYIETNISLNVKDSSQTAQYFGGVAGVNGNDTQKGIIEDATNKGSVIAADADYVGGIVGLNTANGQLLNSSNEGRVEGANYVGGVAGKNEASITGKANDLVTIDNSGVVIAYEGGAGGIFGENTGNIEYAELTNNGIVSGTYNADKVAGTGGLIGVNSGEIKHSSLKNNIGGQVIGTQNVGGLIGVNTGKIEGGRNEQEVDKDGNETVAADSYYKYQIYNNGVITANGNGSNIGGLFGTNSGKVEAAYNTGAINAENSTNVGGIAGTNSGKLDQVFNTVMVNPDDAEQAAAITGGTNVGGLVGTNSGTLSNAYNTAAVEGKLPNAVVGNAVGENTGANANVEFVYDVTNTNNKLIGKNSGNVTGSYSGNEADKNTPGIIYVDEGDRLKENTYQSSLKDANTWKFYDGNSNPLLKVFLTNLTVNETVKIDDKEVTLKDYLNLVYNGKEQDLDIADLIDKGFITAPNKELLNAYKNTLKDQSNGLGESYLLDNADGQKNAGNYQNDEWLYSNQIHSSTTGSFNPNNLGYDINFVDNDGSITVDRATINIDLNDIYHTYGDVDNVYIDKDRHNKTSYEDSYTISNWTELDEVLQDYIEKYLIVQFKEGSDGAVNGDKTQSVGDYNWSLDFTLGGTDASNYQIGEGSGNVNSVTITGTGKSHVEKAKLTININDVDMTYGDKETAISGQYGYAASTNVGEKLVNGDSLEDVIADINYNNTAYNTDGTTKDVIDGKYALQDKNITGGSKYDNYEITINDGEVTMGKAQLVVDINNVDMTYGDKEPTATKKAQSLTSMATR